MRTFLGKFFFISNLLVFVSACKLNSSFGENAIQNSQANAYTDTVFELPSEVVPSLVNPEEGVPLSIFGEWKIKEFSYYSWHELVKIVPQSTYSVSINSLSEIDEPTREVIQIRIQACNARDTNTYKKLNVGYPNFYFNENPHTGPTTQMACEDDIRSTMDSASRSIRIFPFADRVELIYSNNIKVVLIPN